MSMDYYRLKKDLKDPTRVFGVQGLGSAFSSTAALSTIRRYRARLEELEILHAAVGDENYQDIFVSGVDVDRVRKSGLEVLQ